MRIEALSPSLRLHEDGIWYGPRTEPLSYPADANDACFDLEDDSFWFQHRNRCIVSVVRRFLPQEGPIFDIGGGNGFVSAGLEDAGFDVVLVEPGPGGAANAKKRGIRNVICATTQTADFAPGSLPAVGLFDVIEHIEDDRAFLRSIAGLMKRGGRLYATVPAYRFLWAAEDVEAGHFRRYTLRSLSDALSDAGFAIEYATYIFRPLPLPILLLRALPYRLGLSARRTAPARASKDHAVGKNKGLLMKMLDSETRRIGQTKRMRFGGSCLIVARVP